MEKRLKKTKRALSVVFLENDQTPLHGLLKKNLVRCDFRIVLGAKNPNPPFPYNDIVPDFLTTCTPDFSPDFISLNVARLSTGFFYFFFLPLSA